MIYLELIPAILFIAALIAYLMPIKEIRMENKGIKIVQKTKYRWDVMSTSGHMMIEGVYFASSKHAREWAKCYISSWTTWSYELVLKEGA